MTASSPATRPSNAGRPARSPPRACPVSWRTLYQAKARVRCSAPVVPARSACSIARAALRSRPMPFTIPRQAAAPAASGPEAKASAAPPATPRSASTTRKRRRPRRSPATVAISVAAAPPPSPAVTTMPIRAASKPSWARYTPSSTPTIPIASARRNAAADSSRRSVTCPRPAGRCSLPLGVERTLEAAGQVLGRPFPPVVQEHDARLLVGHVVVDRDDVDPGSAQRLEHALQLVLEHREVAVHQGGPGAPGEGRPGVDAHRRAYLGAVHRRLPPEDELDHAVLRLPGGAQDLFERFGIDAARHGNRGPLEARGGLATGSGQAILPGRGLHRVEGVAYAGGEPLGRPGAADVHEEDIRAIVEEVIVQGRHLEAGVERRAH